MAALTRHLNLETLRGDEEAIEQYRVVERNAAKAKACKDES